MKQQIIPSRYRFSYLSSPQFLPITTIIVTSLFFSILRMKSFYTTSICTLVFWTLFYLGLQVWLEKIFGFDLVDGYSRCSYYISLLHQGLIVPFLFLSCCYLRMDDNGEIPESWLSGSWPLFELDATYKMESNFFISVIGYELKDLVYGPGGPLLWIHHLLTIGACTMALFSPYGVGILVVHGFICECGSFFYNFYILSKTYILLILYQIFMHGSHLLGAWMTWRYVNIVLLSLPFKLLCGLITVTLVYGRTREAVINGQKHFEK